eukprot:1184932-Prorocentrum_minimum.AAC.2
MTLCTSGSRTVEFGTCLRCMTLCTETRVSFEIQRSSYTRLFEGLINSPTGELGVLVDDQRGEGAEVAERERERGQLVVGQVEVLQEGQPDQSRRHVHSIFLDPTNHADISTAYFSTRPIAPIRVRVRVFPQPDQLHRHIRSIFLDPTDHAAIFTAYSSTRPTHN